MTTAKLISSKMIETSAFEFYESEPAMKTLMVFLREMYTILNREKCAVF